MFAHVNFELVGNGPKNGKHPRVLLLTEQIDLQVEMIATIADLRVVILTDKYSRALMRSINSRASGDLSGALPCKSWFAIQGSIQLGLHYNLHAPVFVVFEGPVTVSGFVKRQTVRNQKRRIDPSFLNELQQRAKISVNIGLAHLESQPFRECCSKGKLVQEASINTGYRNSAALAASIDCLAQRV